MISDAIYSTPWYYLPVKDQKIILNFLTLTQRTQNLRVFGAFSLTFELVPKIINDALGYVQVMRLLVRRNRIQEANIQILALFGY